MKVSRLLVTAGSSIVLAAGMLVPGASAVGAGSTTRSATTGATTGRGPSHIDCSNDRFACTEVHDSDEAFGHYVGHDEPSVLYYSHKPGSGNRMRYQIHLPKDPPPQPIPGRSYNFQLQIAFWVGMAMCDTQSFPEQVRHCTPNSDTNIVDPAKSPKHPGTAFMEMQFYPPGWVPWQYAISCSATQWCAALTIDSYSNNPVTGQDNNQACLDSVGVEPVNFAFITKNGQPQGPPAPVNATAATFTPNPRRDLFMSSGDDVQVTMHDTAHGLRVVLQDKTSGENGFMTASAFNGFGQVEFAPDATTCTNIPYDFHPMYSTSTPQTRVPWAAHSYNVAFDDEIGHFDHCTKVDSEGGSCTGREGVPGDREPADGDDNTCFSPALSFLVPVTGCIDSNIGFDGVSYQPLWPDGNTRLHPTPAFFSSPLTGAGYSTDYSRVGFESDVPAITSLGAGGTCDTSTGKGCTRVPRTDDGNLARFYPYFSTGQTPAGCRWTIGRDVPGFSARDYGKVRQYGPLLRLAYTEGHGVAFDFEDYRNIVANPCNAY
jgi:hypothetical protein